MDPYGMVILIPVHVMHSQSYTNCEYFELSIDDRLDFILYEKEDIPKSTSHWVRSLEHETQERCPHVFCNDAVYQSQVCLKCVGF